MRILRLIYFHNEEDILDENLKWYIDQGIPTIAIDNSSTDNSYEICKKYLNRGVIELKRITTAFFDRPLLQRAIMELAGKYEPDWVILADADEFYEPLSHKELPSAIREEAEKGYNVIQLHNMEFWMTKKDDPEEKSVLRRIRYYSYFDSNRFRIFKFYPGTSLIAFNGHAPLFPQHVAIKISPSVFISRHYKFRSLKQAYQKIQRIRPSPDRPDVGFHYLKYKPQEKFFIIPSEKLTRYNEDKKWNFERKYNGERPSKQEIGDYLGLTAEEVRKMIKFRNLRFLVEGREIP